MEIIFMMEFLKGLTIKKVFVYYLGIIIDMTSESELENEWENLKLRSNIAKTSVIKLRSIKKRTFFGVGKLHEIA